MAAYRRSVLWRLDCDPPARLWSGAVRDLPLPGDVFDPDGSTYRAAGALLSVPALKTLLTGLADRVDFTVSGVSAETLRLALEDRESVKGARLAVGHVLFAPDWSYVSHRWTWRGVADVLTVASDASQQQRTISLSVASGDTLRSNPQITRYTDADQRRRSPDDAFFDRVAGISVGSTRRFGPR